MSTLLSAMPITTKIAAPVMPIMVGKNETARMTPSIGANVEKALVPLEARRAVRVKVVEHHGENSAAVRTSLTVAATRC